MGTKARRSGRDHRAAVMAAAVAVMAGTLVPVVAAAPLPGGPGSCPGDGCSPLRPEADGASVIHHDSRSDSDFGVLVAGDHLVREAEGEGVSPAHSRPLLPLHSEGRLPETGSRGGEWVIGGIAVVLLIAGSAATLMARRARRRG
ncbi:hypothetical protein ABZS83_07455 [Streptomyces sp. NPDC005426]|uniref:hypothetical protein n=1 Tax=Streptomyces sp. NPDC005426 TaxID=3155344 RepID=UPI0033B368BD